MSSAQPNPEPKKKKSGFFSSDNFDPEKINKLNYSPAAVGIANGILWGSVGMAIDRLFSKLFKSKQSLTSSLIFNGLVAVGMGFYAYKVAKKERDSAQNA